MTTQFQKTAEKILDAAVKIQQIPAPTFHEKERSDYVSQCFKDVGLAGVTQDNRFNVYGRILGMTNARPVVVSAHLDTVFDTNTDLTVKREEGRISGPGIGDNSLAVAVLTNLKEIVDKFDTPPEGNIILVANVCEEGLGDLAGIRAVVDSLAPENPRAYLVLEGMGIHRLYTQGIGSRRYQITARSKGGHSWSDFGEPSAIHTLVQFGQALTKICLPFDPKTTLNIGMIQGGRSINTIADEAHLLLDLRSASEQHLESLVAEVIDLIKSFSRDKTTLDHKLIGNRPAGQIAHDAPLVNLCQQAYQAHGIDNLELKAGSTDANIPFSKNIPAVCLGLTQGKDAHIKTESIETGPLSTGLSILAQILRQIWTAW